MQTFGELSKYYDRNEERKRWIRTQGAIISSLTIETIELKMLKEFDMLKWLDMK